MSGSRNALGGLHLFKVGVDLLHSEYDGTSDSRPVLIERADGTLARRLDFGAPTTQSIGSTDVALFAQDRFQPTTRWYLEFGGRLDRDGVVDRFNVTPRVGTAVLLNASGSAVLRGGFGLFYERTPSTAGAFDQFESATRHAVRGRRRHAARAAGALRARDGARSRDAAQPDVGRRLRPPAEPDVVVSRRRPRSRRAATS